MKVLVTGGTGFLGRHLLRMLEGYEVFALTRGKHAGRNFPANISWIEADLSRGLDPTTLPEKADALIHLAQSDKYRDFPGGAADVFRVNVETPAVLLRWAANAGVSRAVFASTGTVYEPFTGPMREDAACFPTGYYGASKLACETLSFAYQSLFAVCQLRVFFLYGPGQEQMMMARLIDSVRQGQTLTLPKTGDGLEFVPTYVDDCAQIFKRATEKAWRGVWNVASPHRVNFRQLIEAIGRAAGKEPIVQRIDAPQPTPIVPDLSKIRGVADIDRFRTVDRGLKAILPSSASE